MVNTGTEEVVTLEGGHHVFDLDVVLLPWLATLEAGDADQDLDFDQFDLVRVQQAARYLTGQAATWGEGDWNGVPGGNPGDPPPGDGVFDQLDIIAALLTGGYLAGPQAALKPGGRQTDAQTSLVYNARTGQLSVDAPQGPNRRRSTSTRPPASSPARRGRIWAAASTTTRTATSSRPPLATVLARSASATLPRRG